MYQQRDIARQYLQQQILNATPAQQLVMMFDGAIKFTLKAKEAIGQGDVQERHNCNRRAMEIINYLMEILDLAKGGEVAQRLHKIYGFLIRRYLEVDFKNDPRICDEIVEHLKILRGTWDKIAKNEKPAGKEGQASPQSDTAAAPKSAVA